MTTTTIRNFSAGEITPALYSRTDTSKYATGLRTCRNTLVMRHGGSSNRPGTEFLNVNDNHSKVTRLIPFIYNDEYKAVIELRAGYFRLWIDGVLMTSGSAKNISGITQANPAVVTATSHGFSNGDMVYISTAVVGMLGAAGEAQIGGRYFKINNVATHTFALIDPVTDVAINSSSFTAWSSGGSAIKVAAVANSYAEADLFDITYAQSGTMIYFCHPGYDMTSLTIDLSVPSMSALTTYTSFASSITTPTNLTNTGAAGTVTQWRVSAVSDATGEESGSFETGSSATPSVGAPITVNWTDIAISGYTYFVYKRFSAGGAYGLIGTATAGSAGFQDRGFSPDMTIQVKSSAYAAFGAFNTEAESICFYQQRMFLGLADTVFASQTGVHRNFLNAFIQREDSGFSATIVGKRAHNIKHLMDVGKLIAFSNDGEIVIEGNADGAITPTTINTKFQSYNGIGTLPPLAVDESALYVQARNSTVRDLAFDYQVDGYRGNEVSLFSAHLLEGYTITDWTYQKIPHSIVWMVRSDGVLLGLTYVRSQQIFAWHRHDLGGDGIAESVCAIPGDSGEDEVYVVVRRTISGGTVRYIEKLSTRVVDGIEDCNFMDSALLYDGRNTTATTMTLSGGTTWAYDETITITASAATFTTYDVGNEIHLTNTAGDLIRFSLNAFTSSTVMTGKPHMTVPAALRSTAVTTWTRAVDVVSGLHHLIGETVSVLGDGFVVANPNNSEYTELTVTSAGLLTLPNCYGVVRVGFPYISDIETLNIDTSDGETLTDKKKLISKVTAFVNESRGMYVGSKPPDDDATDPLEGLYEIKLRNSEGYNDPTELKTEAVDINLETKWNSNGRVFIRQVDPLPLSILAIHPSGLIPFRGGQ